MNDFFRFLLTVSFSYFCGWLLNRLRFPAGALIGSLLGVIAFNLVTGIGFFYSGLKPVIQTFMGISIASTFKRENWEAIKHLGKPLIFMFAFVFVYNSVLGSLMVLLTDLDFPTALFATAPGGSTDMALIAMDYGADSSFVAIIQTFRVIVLVLSVPLIARKKSNDLQLQPKEVPKPKSDAKTATKRILLLNVPKAADESNLKFYLRTIGFFLACLIGGFILTKLGISGGMLVGGALLGGAYSMWQGGVRFAPPLKLSVMIFAGTLVGCKVTRESVANFDALLLPIVIMCIGTIALTVVAAKLCHKVTKLGILESYFSISPGGITEMSITAEELNADVSTVATIQGIRLLFVIAVMPLLISVFI